MATRMQQRRGTAAQWISTNNGDGPVLEVGEIGFESDTGKFKIGDGVNHWVDLNYFVDGAELSNIIDGAPELLNTLNELAAAIGDDPTFFTTVATNLSNHASDTTNVHGIANTADLATKSYADGKASDAQAAAEQYSDSLASNYDAAGTASSAVSTHNLDTTNVHGIADTALLATQEYVDDAISNSAVDQSSLAGVGIDWNSGTQQFDVDSTVTINDGSQVLTNKTISTADNNITVAVSDISDVTATASELNILDGATVTTAEINHVSGVTSSVQTQLDAKASATDLSNHASDTTSVHGISDTAQLAYKNAASQTFTGNMEVDGNLVVDGNFTVNGTNFAASATSITIEDNLVQLAHQNTGNTVDLGLVVAYNDGAVKHSGIVRDVSADKWKLFKDVTDEPATTVNFLQGSLDDLEVAGLTASSITVGSVSNTEIGYLDGVTSAIQTQLDGKISASSTNALTNKTIAFGSNTVSGTLAEFNTAVTDANLASLAGSETLTNKTISGANNTLSNIGNASLTNSSVTVNGTAISLGSSGTITAANPNALTIGTGLSGTSYTGSSAVTIAIDSTVATLSGTQTLTNKTISSGVLTGTLTAGGGVGTNGQVLQSTGTGVQWATSSAYSAPTLGTTSIPSGATVTTVAGLTLQNASLSGTTRMSPVLSVVPLGGFGGVSTAITFDGINWVAGGNLPSNGGSFIYDVAVYGAGQHLVFGNNISSNYAASTNGITWTTRAIPGGGTGGFNASCVNGTFLLTSSRSVGSTVAYTSTDGINWTTRTLVRDNSNGGWGKASYGRGVFVVPCRTFATAVNTSSDGGATWAARTIASTSSDFASSAYGNGIFVVPANHSNNQATAVYATSPDGISWTQRAFPITSFFRDIAFGNNTFVVTVSGSSTTNFTANTNILTSSDGTNWTTRTLPASKAWSTVAYINGLFVVSCFTDNTIVYSTNGVTWTLGTTLGTGGGAQASSALYYPQDADKIVGETSQPINLSTYTVQPNDRNLIFNVSGTCTITLPSPGAFPGRTINVKSVSSTTLNSAVAFVQPLGSLSPGTAILSGSGAKFAQLVSDGLYWIIMQAN